jgi:hypothetical protein
MSILPFYFRNNGPVLLTNESLIAELELTNQGRIWEIRISGTVVNWFSSTCDKAIGLRIAGKLKK